jgi:diguanylate cyclase (GGDEF)-like protein
MTPEAELDQAGAALRRMLAGEAPSPRDADAPLTAGAGFDPDDAADAADLGHAAYTLGVHYAAAGNVDAAVRWLRVAARRDVGDAASRLAMVLRTRALANFGDDVEASHWFEAASAAGYAAEDADQFDEPVLPLSCCPSAVDEEVTADARRQAEEIIRTACHEAEAVLAAARQQADRIVATAWEEAELPSERAAHLRTLAPDPAGASDPALRDPLTGLANRVLFHERGQHALSRAERTGAVVGVLIADLDDFRVVNDTCGHAFGDELLVAVGQRLAGVLRPQDTVARLGGDAFAVLVVDAHSPADVEEVAGSILGAVAEPFLIGGAVVSVTSTIGVATSADAATVEDLLRQADLALYVAKGAGTGGWRRYLSGMHESILERAVQRAELDRAVEAEAFTLLYQPIVRLDTGTTAGFEAFVRWNHPTRGLIPPVQFIDAAETSGLIVPIGNWVLRTAVAAAAAWPRRSNATQPYVSVNVSVRQFLVPGFVDLVRAELAAAGLPSDRLMLEIPESQLLHGNEQVWRDLAALRELGVRVAVDDFGTGYSSLSYLRQVPIDVLKIDKSFVDTVSDSTEQRDMVDAIVRLSHGLGLAAVAEGVERPADRDALSAIDCRFGQGYLFSGPLTDRDAVRWLRGEQVATRYRRTTPAGGAATYAVLLGHRAYDLETIIDAARISGSAG